MSQILFILQLSKAHRELTKLSMQKTHEKLSEESHRNIFEVAKRDFDDFLWHSSLAFLIDELQAKSSSLLDHRMIN